MIKSVFLSLFFMSYQSWARLAVISDVDDTIKVSHILDFSDMISKGLRTENLFRGMNSLYQEIARNNPDAKFYYVTNAIKKVMTKSHSEFLTRHQFPPGYLLLRESLTIHNHKLTAIRQILQDEAIDSVIFIGDNGERDPEVYAQIKEEFPNLRSKTFIRIAYTVLNSEDRGKPLHEGQTGFVTPVEVSLDLAQSQVLTRRQVNRLAIEYAHETLKWAKAEDRIGDDGTLSFPRWVDCRDFRIPDSIKIQPGRLMRSLWMRIKQRCSIPAIED